MDEEHYSLGEETVEAIVAAREQGRPVIAVGTTVVRALEGCARKNGRLIAAGEMDKVKGDDSLETLFLELTDNA